MRTDRQGQRAAQRPLPCQVVAFHVAAAARCHATPLLRRRWRRRAIVSSTSFTCCRHVLGLNAAQAPPPCRLAQRHEDGRCAIGCLHDDCVGRQCHKGAVRWVAAWATTAVRSGEVRVRVVGVS